MENNILDGRAQAAVVISNLYATDAELDLLKRRLFIELRLNDADLTIRPVKMNAKGTCYEISFTVVDPSGLDIEMFADWLHEIYLVGWNVDMTYVRPPSA